MVNREKLNMRVLIGTQKSLGLIFAVLLFVSSATFAGDEKTNFSGRWVLNSDKSLSEGRRTAAQKELNVRQEENKLVIERISQTPSGKEIITEELTLDGKEKDSLISGKPTKSAVNWSADGKKMVISYRTIFAQNDIRITIEIWALSEDGKSLSVDYSSQSAKGTRKANYVYDKK